MSRGAVEGTIRHLPFAVEELVPQGFESATPVVWAKFCGHVRGEKDESWKDGLIEDTTKEFVLDVSDSVSDDEDDRDDDHDMDNDDYISEDEHDTCLQKRKNRLHIRLQNSLPFP